MSPERQEAIRRRLAHGCKADRRDTVLSILAGFIIVAGVLAANAVLLYVAVRIVRAAWQ